MSVAEDSVSSPGAASWHQLPRWLSSKGGGLGGGVCGGTEKEGGIGLEKAGAHGLGDKEPFEPMLLPGFQDFFFITPDQSPSFV